MKNGMGFLCRTLALLVLLIALPLTAMAQSCCPSDGHGSPIQTNSAVATTASATDLGQTWPRVADQSRSPSWHAYEFTLSGVRYVQVNDANGGVHFAAAIGPSSVVVLPIGSDSGLVSTPATPIAPTLQDTVTPIFSADGITVNLVTNPSGYYWQVIPGS